MTTEQLLIGDHYLFATEVINRLNRFYGIPVRVNQRHADDYFFNNDIRWGIITISYLFRKDFHRIYDQIKNKLKNKKEFENYCMLITVSKNDRYFFNFLRRVALIYEIAVCCYRNGRDYFSRAKRCIMWYQDKLYFRSAGSWPSLNKTASFLRTLGNPLLRVILEESSLKYPLTFSATVDKIEQRLIKSENLKTLNDKELEFFRQRQKRFLSGERDEKENADFQIEKEKAFFQCLKSILRLVNNDTSDQMCNMKERRAIIEYLGSLILPEISNKFHNKSLSSPERTSTNVTDLYEPFEKLFQSKQESDGQEMDKESSTVEKEKESTSLVFKGLSSRKRLSNIRKKEETETSNSEFTGEDLFSSSSAFNDKFSQLYSIDDLINDNIFLTKYINLSTKSNRSESTLCTNNINNSLEMPNSEIFPEYSSEGKKVQQSSNENDHLDNRKDLQNSCSLSSDSKSQLPSSSVDTPKIVSAEQSAINDDKRDTDRSIDDNEGELTIRMGPFTGRLESGILHVQIPTDIFFTSEQTNTTVQTNIPTEINTNNSEIDSNQIVDRPLSNSQPQQRRGKRNRRKKKGLKMPETKRVAVIGAGPCGLGAVKTLKDEGLEPVCFERTGHLGGLWRYHDDDVNGLASVMKTTIINTSKELGAASDSPPPAEYPNYMHHSLMYKYIKELAEKFDCVRHVKYHQETIKIEKADDYEETGRWVVTNKHTQTGAITSDTFDCVCVCIGHHVFPNIPTFPGQEDFQGKIIHTHSLKKVDGYDDLRVAVVGVGNSGMDAAVELSSVTSKVYLSSRRGTWVLPRVGPKGHPFDAIFVRRYYILMQRFLPYNLVCNFSEKELNQRFNHDFYNLKPKHRVWSQHPTVSDSLPIKLLSGTVVVRGAIKRFTKKGVIFENEENETEVDAVVLATGYRIKFPFLSDDILPVVDNKVQLYKFIYPPELPHPTLAILGLIQPSGPGFPVGEMQCRWTSRIMSGRHSLPSKEEMYADIEKKLEYIKKRYVDSPRHTLQVDFIGYQDELAAEIGCKPNLLKILFTDPKLFSAIFFGPSLPYQYRLQGPHAWPGARNAILTYKERVVAPFQRPGEKKVLPKKPFLKTGTVMKLLFILPLVWYFFLAVVVMDF